MAVMEKEILDHMEQRSYGQDIERTRANMRMQGADSQPGLGSAGDVRARH